MPVEGFSILFRKIAGAKPERQGTTAALLWVWLHLCEGFASLLAGLVGRGVVATPDVRDAKTVIGQPVVNEKW